MTCCGKPSLGWQPPPFFEKSMTYKNFRMRSGKIGLKKGGSAILTRKTISEGIYTAAVRKKHPSYTGM